MISGCQSVLIRSLSHSLLCRWRSVYPLETNKGKVRTGKCLLQQNMPFLVVFVRFTAVKNKMLPILCLLHFPKSQSTMSSPVKVWQRIPDDCCTFFSCSIAYGVDEILQGYHDLEDVIQRYPHLPKLTEKGTQTKCVSLLFLEHLHLQLHNLWQDRYITTVSNKDYFEKNKTYNARI